MWHATINSFSAWGSSRRSAKSLSRFRSSSTPVPTSPSPSPGTTTSRPRSRTPCSARHLRGHLSPSGCTSSSAAAWADYCPGRLRGPASHLPPGYAACARLCVWCRWRRPRHGAGVVHGAHREALRGGLTGVTSVSSLRLGLLPSPTWCCARWRRGASGGEGCQRDGGVERKTKALLVFQWHQAVGASCRYSSN